MSKMTIPKDRVATFASKVIKRAKMMITTPRTIDGRTVRRSASGELVDSLDYTAKGNILQFRSAKQGYWVEFGRKPSAKMPPLEPFKKWLNFKQINPRNAKGQFVPRTEARMNSLAFVIARKVQKKGYKGISFYRESVRRELEKNGNDLEQAGLQSVKDGLVKTFRIEIKNGKIVD